MREGLLGCAPVLRAVALLVPVGTLLSALDAGAAPDEPPRAAVAALELPAHEKRARLLTRLIRLSLKDRADVVLTPRDRERFLFAVAPPPDRSRELQLARNLLNEAEEQLRNFAVGEAQQSLEQATEVLEPHVGLEGTRDLDETRLQLAVAIAHAQRDEDHLDDALKAYAARFGREPPDSGLWPPDLTRRLKAMTAAASTALKVTSEPPGEAWVNGKKLGPTPARRDDLPPGRHRVQVRAPAHYPADTWIETQSAKLAEAHLELPPDVGQELEAVSATGALPAATERRLAEVARAERIRLLFLVGPIRRGRVALRALEVGEQSAVATGIVEADATVEGVRVALNQIFQERAEARLAAQRGVSPWAWVGAGAGLAAIGTGIALRLMAVSTQGDYRAQQGALTQASAYGLRDEADRQGLAGSVLIGVGAAALAGVATWVTFDLLTTPEAP